MYVCMGVLVMMMLMLRESRNAMVKDVIGERARMDGWMDGLLLERVLDCGT
jgi:hypothetical protein